MWKWLERLTGGGADGDARSAALYGEVVDLARRPEWYESGGVEDDVDGRFDMVVLALSLYLLRLERDEADPRARAMTSLLVERFVADMDGSFREIGIGDMVIGKHMGRALEALGGRLGAYRDALADDAAPLLLDGAIARNVFRGEAPDPAPVACVAAMARDAWRRLIARPLEDMVG